MLMSLGGLSIQFRTNSARLTYIIQVDHRELETSTIRGRTWCFVTATLSTPSRGNGCRRLKRCAAGGTTITNRTRRHGERAFEQEPLALQWQPITRRFLIVTHQEKISDHRRRVPGFAVQGLEFRQLAPFVRLWIYQDHFAIFSSHEEQA